MRTPFDWKRKITLLGLLCWVTLLSACETAPNTPATRTATANYPGKNKEGECYIYGNCLYTEMQRQKIPSWKIVYHGTLSTGYEFAYHEVVVYWDAGKYWVVDNENPYPTPVAGGGVDDWVHNLCGELVGGEQFAYHIESVNDVQM